MYRWYSSQEPTAIILLNIQHWEALIISAGVNHMNSPRDPPFRLQLQARVIKNTWDGVRGRWKLRVRVSKLVRLIPPVIHLLGPFHSARFLARQVGRLPRTESYTLHIRIWCVSPTERMQERSLWSCRWASIDIEDLGNSRQKRGRADRRTALNCMHIVGGVKREKIRSSSMGS